MVTEMRYLYCLLLIVFVFSAHAQEKAINWEDTQANAFVDSLLQEMTLDEKIGQMTLFTSDYDVTGPTMRENYLEDIRSGRAGAIFNAHTVAYTRQLQEIAVKQTRLGIPLLFGYDVIHGHQTIFPIPLAEAASWNLPMIEKSARLAAKEAAASGLHWTFNPMVDVARDPRWGRIAEGSGEDPYLGSLIARAKVKGIQGDDLGDPYTLLACVKHFAAYGAPQAGRDYHTVDMSELRLRETYLPPYQAAIEAGAATVMTAFNELFGMPATGSRFLLNDILREEWGFEGFVVTDYTSINEMVPHGVAATDAEAGVLAVSAGVDMDMQGAVFYNHLAESVGEGEVNEERLDEAVRKILLAKYFLGLFEDPFKYADAEREAETVLSDELFEHALQAGRESIVLLKNDSLQGQPLLPISDEVQKIALIGPLADNQIDLLGTWHASGDESRVTTLLQALREEMPGKEISYAYGSGFSGNDTTGFDEARQLAREADLVLLAVGENYQQSGEAASRSKPGLPGPQEELVKSLQQTGKPMAAIVMAGRPLIISWMDENLPSIVYAWHLGSMAGPAIAEVLSGAYNPSASLPITFPRNVGQIPIYYNMKMTGRPFSAENKYTSKYLDVSNEPLYPFGYGLSYTKFAYNKPELSKTEMTMGDSLRLSVDVRNIGDRAGQEIVQLYVRDLVGSLTRPVMELKGFQKIRLEAGASQQLTFTISTDDLAFVNRKLEEVTEAGEFEIMVGPDVSRLQRLRFEVTE
jgi:beta-glucosidase